MTGQVAALDDLPEYLNTAEAAEVLRVDVEYVKRQCKNGALKATNLRGKAGWRIHRDAVREFLGSAPPPAQPRPPRGRSRAR